MMIFASWEIFLILLLLLLLQCRYTLNKINNVKVQKKPKQKKNPHPLLLTLYFFDVCPLLHS